MFDFQTAYERLRSPENRIYLGAFVRLLAITGIVGCLVLYQFIKAPQTTPALVFAPKAFVTMTLEATVIPAETATLPVQQEIFVAPTANRQPGLR
jgi:hypothetical protein